MQGSLLHGKDNSREDESEIDRSLELYVGELLEDVQAKIGPG